MGIEVGRNFESLDRVFTIYGSGEDAIRIQSGIIRPRNDLFLVWSNNWLYDDGPLRDSRFSTLSRGGAVKVNYTFRF